MSLFLLASKTITVRSNDVEVEMEVAMLRTLPLGTGVKAYAEVRRRRSSERIDFIVIICVILGKRESKGDVHFQV